MVFPPPAHAEAKKITTCEEWKNIYGTDECQTAAHWKDKKGIWCYDLKETESSEFGEYVGRLVNENPPTYIAEFDYDACIEEWGKEKGYSSPIATSDPAQSSKSVFFIPSGLISSLLNVFKSRPKSAPETQQVETPKQETKSATQTLDDWIRENHIEYNPKNVAPKPSQLKEEMFQKALEEWKSATKYMGEERQSTFEFLWEGEWPNVKAVVIDKESGIILQSEEWGKPYIQELADEATNKVMSPFLESPDEFTKRVIFQQGDMEVKVINANPTVNKVSVDVDDFFDIFVIQTHFRVAYDPDKKLGVVNVYEGEVEVRTKDGKTVKVRPAGEKPGVVVITKKFSVPKLALAGLALGGILGGVFLIVKRGRGRSTTKRK